MKQVVINIVVVILDLTLILLSNINGHINPPFSIEATPILILVIIGLINNPLYRQNFTLTVLYNFGLLLFNDIFIRTYAGGYHDSEGKGWIFLFFSIAFILAVITMLVYAFTAVQNADDEVKKRKNKSNISIVVMSAFATGLIYCGLISGI